MARFENDDAKAYPLEMELEAGTYAWCACGKTKTVPFCDGSHEGTGIEPVEFTIDQPTTAAICNCGLTSNPPYCDGSHVDL